MPDGNEDTQKKTYPKKWWQIFFLYPTLFAAIIGAIPTYYEMIRSRSAGVDFGKYEKSKQQNALFAKNASCLKAPFDPLITDSNVKVDATICESGDVYITFVDPKGNTTIEWVSIDISISSKSAALGIINQAVAYEVDESIQVYQGGYTVLCQRWIDKRILMRRISIPGSGCFDEHIDTYTGAVVDRQPAQCDSNC